MTTYGVTSTGFVPKPLNVILDEIEAYQRANISPSINQEADGVVGQINAIMAAKFAELWEVAQGVYASQYPDSATGASLDNACALNGATRLNALKSVVTLHCTGVNGTVLAAGRHVSDPTSGAIFITTAGAVIAGGVADVAAECSVYGPITGNAGTLTHIDTPVAGWATVTNVLDAVVGRNVETDEDFRARRLLLLELGGNANQEAIRAALLDVLNVTEAIVFQNDTDFTVDTIPPHSIECVVLGGADADIRASIFASKAAGTQAFGSTHGTVIDSNGDSHEVDFTRVADDVLHVNVVLLTDPAKFPATGAQMVKDSMAAFALATYRIGDDVIRNKLFEPCFKDFTNPALLDIPGVLDVLTLEIKFGGAFATANLAVTSREIATLDTSNIAVAVT
jgi:uncharacterized phage protein gp47/JayE